MSMGAFYIATGRRYIDEACRSAASLKTWMPHLPITLFCDEMVQAPHFELVVPIARPQHRLIDKVMHMNASTYERSLFLDTDTYLCDDVSELFTLLDKFDIAVAHNPYRALYLVDGVPDSYPEFNNGVIVFKQSPRMRRFLAEWLALYERDLKKEIRWSNPAGGTWFHGDLATQPTFREALYQSDLRVATLTPEYNCRFYRPGFVHRKVKILHGRHPDLQAVAVAINADTGQRVFVKRLGRVKVIVYPERARLIDKVKRSLWDRGVWRTAVSAARRVFERLLGPT